MEIDYSSIAVMVEYIIGTALKEGKELASVEELINYLDENAEEFITVK